MGNSTIWMRMTPQISKLTRPDLCIISTVAYKQAALNAIAYLMKVCILFWAEMQFSLLTSDYFQRSDIVRIDMPPPHIFTDTEKIIASSRTSL